MLIVGINAYHGDASAAAIVEGRLVAAAEEERFTRIKHAAGFPVEALKSGGTRARGVGAGESPIPVGRVEHHRAHLASSFLVSPFDEAALFSIDGLGDFASAMWGVGRGGTISPMGVVTFPHSLGMFYTALTQYLGFPKYGDEYKVMGLASYGEPEVVEEFRKIVIAPNGGRMDFMLAPEYFTSQKSGGEITWGAGEP